MYVTIVKQLHIGNRSLNEYFVCMRAINRLCEEIFSKIVWVIYSCHKVSG